MPTPTRKRQQPAMRTYSLLLASDVPHYAPCEIEAATVTEAIEAARKLTMDDAPFVDPDWEWQVCRRIVHIEDEDGVTVAENIALDDWVLIRKSDGADGGQS